MKKNTENVDLDKINKLLKEVAGTPMTQEERREQRISFILSVVGKFDENTGKWDESIRKEVEKVVDGQGGFLT